MEMESEDSRPGSSSSSSSSNSSENSSNSPSSSTATIEGQIKNSITAEFVEDSEIKEDRFSRSRSRSHSPNDGVASPRSSKHNSRSSSSSSNQNKDSPAQVKRCQTSSPLSKSNRSSSSSSAHSECNRPENNYLNNDANINQEDLSDVSDMESGRRDSILNSSKHSLEDDGTNTSLVSATFLENDISEPKKERRFSLETDNSQDAVITDLRQKLDQIKTQGKGIENKNEKINTSADNSKHNEPIDSFVKTNDEDALDFEAEEGECQDIDKNEQNNVLENEGKTVRKSDGEVEEGEELEEGEVSDEDEKRPEEIEPKPVCRFYTRGQCTWGMSCRFLHPGVTDKGNYTMFDLVRPVPLTQSAAPLRSAGYNSHPADYHDYRVERQLLHHRTTSQQPASYGSHHDIRTVLPEGGPVVVESAWERGLRTAKEMMRKANKRKEQDMDFEDKKMNLTVSPDEIEKDSYYLKDRGSPPEIVPSYVRHAMYQDSIADMYGPSERYVRGPPPACDEVDPYGRTTRYRELPPHRMPQYEDERRVRPTREVIVQRVEPVGRGDEWRDPWMRSPGMRGESRDHGDKRRHEHRNYSSNSSYSSSSSSRSDSSSDSSRSSTPTGNRRRYNSSSQKSSPPIRRHDARTGRSRHSPSARHSPVSKIRGSTSPVLDKRSAYGTVHKRKMFSPNMKKSQKKKLKRHVSSSSSGSGSSDSTDTDSDSGSGSSSSDSSTKSRDRISKPSRFKDKLSHDRNNKKAEPPKRRSPISIEIKRQPTVGISALNASPTHSITSESDLKKSRREELLKQLRAVEDAIAKKRSKLA